MDALEQRARRNLFVLQFAQLLLLLEAVEAQILQHLVLMLAQQRYLRLDLEIFLRYLLVLLENLARAFARVVGRERPQVGIQKATNIAQVFARGAATCDIEL